MKFPAYLMKNAKKNEHHRLAFSILKSNHDFPMGSSLDSINKYCREKQLSDHVKLSLNESWNDFIILPYATIFNSRLQKKKEIEN